jgi:AcrR family transcriptional regulator
MDKKSQYTDAVADYLLSEGLAAASLRPLAKAVGTSDRMLIYHFGSKAEILEAGLQRASDRLFDHLRGEWNSSRDTTTALAKIFDELSGPELRGYTALWQDIVTGAMRGDAVCRRAGHAMVETYIPWLEEQLPDPSLAALTLAVIDGTTQLQAVGRDQDVRNVLSAYLKLLANRR